MKSSLWCIGIIVLAGGLYFSAFYDVGLNILDEGYYLSPALRVMEGDVPYRDFNHFYPPGRFYLLALLFSILGKNILVARILWVMIITGSGILSFCILRRFVPLWAAMLPSFFIIGAPGPLHKGLFTFLALLLLLLLLRLESRGDKASWFGFGLACGLAFYFRQDIAIYAVLVLAFLELPMAVREPRNRLPLYFSVTGGLALLIFPFIAFFTFRGALAAALDQIFLAGRTGTGANALPFPAFWPPWPASFGFQGWIDLGRRMIHYYPPAVYLLTVLSLIAGRRRTKRESARMILAILLMGILMFQQDLRRTDVSHLMQAIAPAHLLAIILVTRYMDPEKKRAKKVLLPVCALFLMLLIFIDGYRFYYPNSILVLLNPLKELNIPGCRVRTHPRLAEDLEATVTYMNRVLKPEETFLALPDVPIFYFLLNRKNPLPYEIIRAGHLRSETAEQHLIDLIESSGIRYLIYNRYELDDGRPGRRLSGHAPRLYGFLKRRYFPEKTFPLFTISKRVE